MALRLGGDRIAGPTQPRDSFDIDLTTDVAVKDRQRQARSPSDPFVTTNVFAFGHLYIALGDAHRLVAVGVHDRHHDSMLVVVCGRDEYGAWQTAQNDLQKARRRRAREQVAS